MLKFIVNGNTAFETPAAPANAPSSEQIKMKDTRGAREAFVPKNPLFFLCTACWEVDSVSEMECLKVFFVLSSFFCLVWCVALFAVILPLFSLCVLTDLCR